MDFTTFQPLVWLLLLTGLMFGMTFSLVDRPKSLKWGSFALRALGIVLLILALCQPFASTSNSDLHVIFLVDVSESIALKAADTQIEKIELSISQLQPNDSWSLFAVAAGVRPFKSTKDLRTVLDQWQSGIADDAFRGESRIADALLNTRLAFPFGKSRRIVLFSDGQETNKELTDALATLSAEEVDVQFQQVEGIRKTEASIVSFDASSPFAYQGETIRLNTVIASNQAIGARLRILNKGVALSDQRVSLEARPHNQFEVDVEMTTPGPSVWTAELIPDEDFFPINNQLTTNINVKGKPRVLVLHREPTDMRPFSRALEKQDFEVDVRGERGLPESMAEILAFNAVVLADIPATSLSTRQMELLRNYVADFGGGLAMFGSENSFGLGGYYKTPVEEVLPLVSRFEQEKEKPALAMVLVIDQSGSMVGQPIQLARQAAKSAVELLGDQDQIAVIGFDSDAQVVSEMRYAIERNSIKAAIDSLAPGGGTNVFPAMRVGRDMLEASGSKIQHMIILSDGKTPGGEALRLAQEMGESRMTVSTVALGQGASKNFMAKIAAIGNGRYYETVDPKTVPQIFTKETMQASKAAIKEDLYGSVQVGDHPILSGYQQSDLPFSLGYVMTQPKPTSQVLLATETGDPLMAITRFGLGVGLCWTSDLTEKWGGEWLAWNECGPFWSQAIRGLINQSDTEGLIARIEQTSDDLLELEIDRTDPNQMPVNGISWDATALDDRGNLTSFEVEPVGLGKYRASIPITGAKELTIRIRDLDSDKTKILQYMAGYPEEYRLSNQVPKALAQLDDFDASSIRTDIIPNDQPQPVAHWFVFAAMGCVLGGMVLRRV